VFTSTDCVFSGFRPVSVDDVAAAVRAMPNKQSADTHIDMAAQGMHERVGPVPVPFIQRITAR